MGTAFRSIGALLLVMMGLGLWQHGRSGEAEASMAVRPSTAWGQAAGALDRRIAALRAQPQESGDWLRLEQLASAHSARGKLTGNYADFAAARRALDQAFAIAPRGAGPHLALIDHSFGVHKLASTERAVAAVEGYALPNPPETRAEMLAIRGDLALYSGRYAEAKKLYDAADAIDPHAGQMFRRAILLARTGDPDGAKALFTQAEKATRFPSAQFRANIEMQRGIVDLDRGRYAEALAQFDRAEALFPGHWLIAEHRAETLGLMGRLDEAEAIYRAVIAQTHAPDFMDALAGVLDQQGKKGEASEWRGRAHGLWLQRMQMFPEASYGHALDHWLAHDDARTTLMIARANVKARPYGEAQIGLARALIKAGDGREALAVMQAVRRSGWKTPDADAAFAEACAASGPGACPALP